MTSSTDMATDAAGDETAAQPTEEQLPAWARPAEPSAGAPRWIRVLTGIREPVLDRVPTERPRYTALACVMIGTSLIGGISMFFALSEMTGSARLAFVPLALFWSGFVLCLDRWLVASMAGHRFAARLGTAVLRILVATVFGVIIAEPLVLRVFDTAITAQVDKERAQAISTLRSGLAACNPSSGAHPRTAGGFDCSDLGLSVSAPAGADQEQVTQLENQASALQATITAETAQETALSNKVNDECNGTAGTGLTGHLGDGPACQQDQKAYSDFLGSHPIAKQNSQLSTLQGEIAALQGTAANDAKSTQAQLSTAVERRVSQLPQPGSPVGLVERLNALSHLSLASASINAAAWLVRTLFVLIDCLPVLVKFASGVTPYDELAGDLISGARSIALKEMRACEEAADRRISAELGELNAEYEMRIQSTDFDVRRHAGRLEADELAAIDEDYERRLSTVEAGAHNGEPVWTTPLNGKAYTHS
jgi:hypothetical protein